MDYMYELAFVKFNYDKDLLGKPESLKVRQKFKINKKNFCKYEKVHSLGIAS